MITFEDFDLEHTEPASELATKVRQLCADAGEATLYVGQQGQLFVNCNDFFYWGCADAEEVTAENLPVLEACILDVSKALSPDKDLDTALMLYCARIRTLRPQGACYPHLPQAAWPLFDACGPAREPDFGNPLARPS